MFWFSSFTNNKLLIIETEIWSRNEIKQFEKAILKFDKCFSEISTDVSLKKYKNYRIQKVKKNLIYRFKQKLQNNVLSFIIYGKK